MSENLVNVLSRLRENPIGASLLRFIEVTRDARARSKHRLLRNAQEVASILGQLELPGAAPHCIQIDADGVWALVDERLYLLNGTSWGILLRYSIANELAALQSVLDSPEHIFDVGANVGLHSIGLARRYPECTITAFEPVPATAAMLAANVEKNHLDRVRVVPGALLDRAGTVRMTTAFAAGNYAVGARSAPPLLAPSAAEVSCSTADHHWESLGRPNVAALKIDVEGAEHKVLRGARNLLRECRPVLLLELSEAWQRRLGSSVRECVDFLSAHNYAESAEVTVGPPSWESLGDFDPSRSANYLFR